MKEKTTSKGNPTPTLGERLQTARNMAHMTQDTLAQKLFLSRSGWANYEADARKPPLQTLKRAAEELGVSLGYLIGEEESIDILAKHYSFASNYLTEDDHLDLSNDSIMTKILMIEFYLFIRSKFNNTQLEE